MINDSFLNKLQPQDITAEESLISSILLDKESMGSVVDMLSPIDFYKDSHKYIYEAAFELFKKNEPVDLVTVADKLKKNNKIDRIGGVVYLAQIVDTIPMAVNVVYYAKIIKEKSSLRKLIKEVSLISGMCFEDSKNTEEIIDYANESLTKISDSFFDVEDIKSGSVLANTVLDNIEKNSINNGISGVTTGLYKLDDALCGLQQATLITIAGRPSSGKTSLALTIAKNVAVVDDVTVFIKSYETKAESLSQRIICAMSGINSEKLRKGQLTESEWVQLNSAANDFSKLKIKIDDNSKDGVSDIRRKALKIKKENGLGLIIIDHLTRMPLPKADRHDLRVGAVTSSLSHMANDLEIPVILLSQLNRELEKRDNKRPKMSDLKNSSSIEEDSDVLVFVYRDSVYNTSDPLPYDELIIAKARDGRLGTVRVQFVPEITKFIDYYG